jgi:MSHA pilin protein MshC
MKKSIAAFSLVELVMVLVVVGILSVSALGLFASKSDFSASLAKDQLIASVHLAQQRALASHTADSVSHLAVPVYLDITETALDWTFVVRQGSVSSSTQTAERAGATLVITGVALPASIAFAQNGDLQAGADLGVTFAGGTSHALCISSAGFAFAAPCP